MGADLTFDRAGIRGRSSRRCTSLLRMDPTRKMVVDELDFLDEVLRWVPTGDKRAAFAVGCRFLDGLSLDETLRDFVEKRLSSIQTKHGIGRGRCPPALPPVTEEA